MNSLEQKAAELEELLKKLNAPVLKYLNPGLKEQEIIAFFEEKHMKCHPDMLQLYKWHDGIDFPPEGIYSSLIEIAPFAIFYSLEIMARTFDLFTEWNFIENLNEYLPIFGSGESETFLFKISDGSIHFTSPFVGIYNEPAFRSLEIMFDFFLECYSKNILTVDSETGVEIKEDEYLALEEKYKKK